LIARQLVQTATIEFIAKAPDGKEVEELARKEILLSLARKIPVAMYRFSGEMENREYSSRPPPRRFPQREFKPNTRGRGMPQRSGRRPPMRGNFSERPRERFEHRSFERPFEKPFEFDGAPRAMPSFEELRPAASQEENQKFGPIMQELKNSLKARFLDEKNNTIKEVSVRDLLDEMHKNPATKAVVFDGIVTKRLVDAAQENNIECLVGVKKGRLENSEKVKVVTMA